MEKGGQFIMLIYFCFPLFLLLINNNNYKLETHMPQLAFNALKIF